MGGFSGGISFSPAALAALSAAPANDTSSATDATSSYRPSQWAGPPLTAINTSDGTMYVFDGFMKIEHALDAHGTEHPVQTGANLIDHVFILPARLLMEVLMTDVLDSYASGMWSGQSASKSVNAFTTMVKLQQQRTPLSITTRLQTYSNMFIEGIQVPDDFRTRNGLRAVIRLKQIFMAVVAGASGTGDSARPNSTDSSQLGTTNPAPVPANVQQNNIVAPGTTAGPGLNVLGSQSPTGGASSNNDASDPTDGS
jgi:hypothetical protein